jgi:hypothetical protein
VRISPAAKVVAEAHVKVATPFVAIDTDPAAPPFFWKESTVVLVAFVAGLALEPVQLIGTIIVRGITTRANSCVLIMVPGKKKSMS